MADENPPPEIVFRNALVSRMGDDWVSIASKDDAGKEETVTAKENKARLQDHLKGLLTNFNVIVLAGSGASIDAVSPGIGGPKMPDLWNGIAAWEEFEDIKNGINYSGPENIEDFLSQCHNSLFFVKVEIAEKVRDFIKKAEKKIYESCTAFLKDDPTLSSHEELLDKLTKRKSRFPRPKIFTTNYDLCFESAAARKGLTIIDGFSYSQPRKFNPNFFGFDIVRRAKSPSESNELVEGVIQLFKIHGSADWEVSEQGIRQIKEPHEDRRCLIYPAATKYQHSYNQPYLEMMARFLMSLREPNTTLIVVGFGFNDTHLNAPILAAIQSNPSLSVLVVDPLIKETTEKQTKPSPHFELAKYTMSRVTLLNSTFGQFSNLIPDLKALGWNSEIES